VHEGGRNNNFPVSGERGSQGTSAVSILCSPDPGATGPRVKAGSTMGSYRRCENLCGATYKSCSSPQSYIRRPHLLTAAPVLLGTDGTQMSKSRGNAIELRASEDETARLIRTAKTDTVRVITYDPDSRPEVASLVLLAALCTGTDPNHVAESIGTRGASALKTLVIEAVNERLRAHRRRRAELIADPAYLTDVLAQGNVRANQVADGTLRHVRQVMGMTYQPDR